MLHVGNQKCQMTNLPPPPQEIKRIEKLTEEQEAEKEKKDAEKPRLLASVIGIAA